MAQNNLPDKIFIRKLNDILENNYHKEDFGVAELSEKVGFSHTQLHRKIKAEFGKSTSQYIREFRLEKAMILLSGDLTSASEVAYKVGFNSPTYFNQCFNNYFGYPPGKVKYHSGQKPELANDDPDNSNHFENRRGNSSRKLSKWQVPGILLLFIVLFLISLYFIFIRGKENQHTYAGSTQETSVAVLPFKNLSEDNNNQFFADGVMDDIITRLSTIKDLRVISRTTMDKYKESSKTVPEIARELKVSYVIEATIQKYRDSIRLIVQLIDAKKDKNIWARDFRREFKNIFVLESDIAKQIAIELKATLSPSEIERIDRAPTENMEAYTLYLQGNNSFNSNDDNKLVEYEKLLNRCLELDPGFALAYAALARVKIQRMRAHFIPATKQEIEEAKALAIRSIEIDDNARGHASLGWLYLWFEWNWEEAEKQFRRAIQINPNEANGHVYLSEFLYNIKGDFIEARKHLDLALYLAPYAYYPRQVSAGYYFTEGDINKSLEEIQKMKEIDIKNPSTYWFSFLIYITLGEENKAFDELIQGWGMNPDNDVYILQIKQAYIRDGLNGVFEWLFNNENNIISGKPFLMAQYYALAGEKQNVILWLEKSYELHDSRLPYIKYDPLFQDLHADKRFLAILEKMNLGSY